MSTEKAPAAPSAPSAVELCKGVNGLEKLVLREPRGSSAEVPLPFYLFIYSFSLLVNPRSDLMLDFIFGLNLGILSIIDFDLRFYIPISVFMHESILLNAEQVLDLFIFLLNQPMYLCI
jgi:hypothetical protein